MRDSIQALIEEYTHTIDLIEEDMERESKPNFFMSGKMGAYIKVVEDLNAILEESENKE